MDYESLVEEVTKRVLERLAEVKFPSVSKERRVAELANKLITEAHLKNVKADGYTAVKVKANAIVTELAKDYAHDNAVDILRE